MASQHFTDLLKKMDEVHQRKNHDYAQDSDPFSNFTRASELISWFKNPIDQVFAGIIGIKLTRLAELLNGKEPKNESLDDNMLDLANYCGLWAAMKLRDREVQEKNESLVDITMIPHLPEICSECKQKTLWPDAIEHAVKMHGAVWNYTQRTLKYPRHGFYLFPPNYGIGKYEHMSAVGSSTHL